VNNENLTTAELSKEFKVADITLRGWRHRGIGPRWFKLGGRVVYKRSDVEAWMQEQYEQTGPKAS
jgi:predicted site-specific integrase-resolvase